MTYVVSKTIAGTGPYGTVEEINYYRGENLAQAMSAMTLAAAETSEPNEFYTTKEVKLTIL